MLVSTLGKILHVAAIVHFAYALYTWNTFSDKENAYRKYEYGGKWVYLTFLNVVSVLANVCIDKSGSQGHFYQFLDYTSRLLHPCTYQRLCRLQHCHNR